MIRPAHAASRLLIPLLLAACGGAADDGDGASVGTAEGAADAATAAGTEATREAGLPDGWSLRLDREGGDPAEFRVAASDGAIEIRTGPAGILWREGDAVADGPYAASATFTEVGAPAGHREAYGLLIGGSGLAGEDQAYTYFLVRGDGSFLVKRRAGGSTSNVTDGWQTSDAVATADAEGDPTNALAIRVGADSVRFLVNGTEVAAMPSGDVDTRGLVGLRANHNLHLRVADFSLER